MGLALKIDWDPEQAWGPGEKGGLSYLLWGVRGVQALLK